MTDVRLALYILGATGVLLLLLRFGKMIARYIIFGALAVAGIIGLALYEHGSLVLHGRATRAVANAATIAGIGQTATSTFNFFFTGILVTIALAGLVASGYFYLRWKLAERRATREPGGSTWLPGPNARWRRRVRETERPMIYVVQAEDETSVEPDEDDGVDSALAVLRDLDLSKWGW